MVRFIEDTSKNYRGNYDTQMVCFSTANSLFISDAQMSYSCFKKFARRLAEYFHAYEIVINDVDYDEYLITVFESYDEITGEYSYKFYHEPSDAKSYQDRIYYEKEDFQRTQKLRRKDV